MRFLTVLAILTASSAASAANSNNPSPACTYEMCLSSALKHGHSQPVASRWCSAHMKTGDACKNVGK